MNFLYTRFLKIECLNIVSDANRSNREILFNSWTGSKGPAVLLQNLRLGLTQNRIAYRLMTSNQLLMRPESNLPRGQYMILSCGNSEEAIKLTLKIGRNDTIIGPNIACDLPMANFLDSNRHLYSNYLVPSIQAKISWRETYPNLTQVKLKIWPIGIDINRWKKRRFSVQRKSVIVYKKGKANKRDSLILDVIREMNLEAAIFNYGSYRSKDFLKELKRAKFAIWLAEHESQGISFFETWATDVPILIRTCAKFDDWDEKYRYCPFLHPKLGSFLDDHEKYSDYFRHIQEFIADVDREKFHPRDYILSNFSTKQSITNLFSKQDH